jgi:hypothetical protein
MKKKVTVISIVVFGVLLILTFVSRSIYNYSLPIVTADRPMEGSLTLTKEVPGRVEYPDECVLRAIGDWVIDEVKVKDGEGVFAGRVIYTFDTRASDMEIQSLRLDVLSKMTALEQLDNNATADKREEYSTALDLAQTRLDFALSQAPPTEGLVSPFNGVAFGITPQPGASVKAGSVIAIIAPNNPDDGKPFLTFNLPLDADTAFSSDVSINAAITTVGVNYSYQRENVSGSVFSSALRGDSWEFTASLNTMRGRAAAGQEIPVTVSALMGSEAPLTLIQSGSLFDDGNGGKCVYIIEERYGMFGFENYVKKLNVTVLGNNNVTAAIDGLPPGGVIIAGNPSKPLSDGVVVWVD